MFQNTPEYNWFSQNKKPSMGGTTSSTVHSRGTLDGACPPPISRTSIGAEPIVSTTRQIRVTIPPGLGKGDVFKATFEGRTYSLQVPAHLKSGDKMIHTIPDLTNVYASTLHSLPGMVIVAAKPIVFGSVCHAFHGSSGIQGQVGMGEQVGRLMQEAQGEVLAQAVNMDCNAVLGMSFSVTNDSSGESGWNKVVIVTAYGTPCMIVPENPVIQATAFVETLRSED